MWERLQPGIVNPASPMIRGWAPPAKKPLLQSQARSASEFDLQALECLGGLTAVQLELDHLGTVASRNHGRVDLEIV